MLMIEVHGDSGSWMIQKENSRIYGHIVAGDPGSGVAYIMPARRLFQDIEFQTGNEIALYSLPEVKSEDVNQDRQSQLAASSIDTFSLTPKPREDVPLVSAPEELAKRNEYFVPGDGIDVEVITADLTLYLGNDVLLRTGSFQVCYTSTRSINLSLMCQQSIATGIVRPGYLITAFRGLTLVKPTLYGTEFC
jgi:hypothetical protein